MYLPVVNTFSLARSRKVLGQRSAYWDEVKVILTSALSAHHLKLLAGGPENSGLEYQKDRTQ
jgi:hypothetical protein